MMLNTNAISFIPKSQGIQGFGSSSIIPIHGVLTKRGCAFDELFGTTSYTEIYENISTSILNPDVEQIVLDIDSPGGEVSGLFDICDFIKQAKQEKPIVAYANDVTNFKLNSFNKNIFQMEKFMEIEEKIAETEAEQVAKEVAETPNPSNENQEEVIPPKAAEPETQGYREEISEIAKLCKLAKMPEKLAEFIESGTSINDARDSLMKALAIKRRFNSSSFVKN